MEIREPTKSEQAQALDLAWEVFMEFGAPDYRGDHISLFFVKKAFHKKGIGK